MKETPKFPEDPIDLPQPVVPPENKGVLPFEVSDKIKKEVDEKIWQRMHPGEVNFDRRSKSEQAD